MSQKIHSPATRTAIPVTSVQYLAKFFSEAEVQQIQRLVKKGDFQDGEILGAGTDSNTSIRQSKIKGITVADNNRWLFQKILDKINELNSQFWKFDIYGITELLQYTEYKTQGADKGHYDWHLDVSHEGLSSNRKLSFECILEEDHAEGEFAVLLGPTEHKLKLQKGDMVIFPSFLLNKVYPVQSGVRKSLVGWISGPAFK